MFCTRCQRTVPDFLWLDSDHPVLTEKPMTLTQSGDSRVDNRITVTAQIEVQMRMCSDVYYVRTNKDLVDREPEDAKTHFAVSEDGKTEQHIPLKPEHPFVSGYPKPSD